MFTVYGQRYNKYDPIIDPKTNEVIDDGQPKKIQLTTFAQEKLANTFAENVKANTQKRSWKIFVIEEEI
jgi:hypothetical protein